MAAKFVTYILRCADDTLYTGWTDDLSLRLLKHNEGKGARYTRARLPVYVEASWQFCSKADAMRAEWHLKRLSRAEKIDLIEGRVKLVEALAHVPLELEASI